MTLEFKSDRLRNIVEALGSVLVAYSGGTDSAYLAFVAHAVLGDKMLAVIADSPSLPRAELAAALSFVKTYGIPIQVLNTRELADPNYQRNDSQRCFHCKQELFTEMEALRQRLGFEHLAYGRNVDDDGEFRPGQKAAIHFQAVAPLAAAELKKAEVRFLAQSAGLSIWNKPASACLASRIEYGRAVTPENLMQVERAEAALHDLGIHQARVRHHGELARIEIDRAELNSFLTLEKLDLITASLRELGFTYVTLDTQGYRSGSMNDILPTSAIRTAGQPLNSLEMPGLSNPSDGTA